MEESAGGFANSIAERNKAIQAKYDIPAKHHSGMMIIFGYPEVRYRKGVKRRFGRVHHAG